LASRNNIRKDPIHPHLSGKERGRQVHFTWNSTEAEQSGVPSVPKVRSVAVRRQGMEECFSQSKKRENSDPPQQLC